MNKWEMVKLSDAFDLQMGKTPSRSKMSYWNDGTNKWVSIADIGLAEKYINKTKETITDLAVVESGIKLVPKDTVIMSFKLSLGKTCITTENLYTNEAIMAFIDIGKYNIDKLFIYHMFKNKDWSTGTNKAVMGVTLNKGTLSNVKIALPPLETQKKIAKTLDTASELLAMRKQQLAELDKLIKSTFYDMFGDPVTNEKGWEIISLGELLEGIKYGTSTPPLFSSSGYNFIRATNIKSGRIVDSDMKFISENEASKISKCKLKGGELIIVRSGVNSGDTCVITEKYVGHYAGYDMIITPKQSSLNPIYLNELINTNFMKQVVKPLTRRAAQPHINADQTKKMPIILPALELQTQFSTIITKIEEQKALVKEAIDETQYLLDSLMSEYFE